MTRISCFILAFVAAVSAFVISGCASVPVTETGNRGLLQKAPSAEQPTLPLIPSAAATAPSDAGFLWPVKEGRVTSFFGHRRRDFHEGIDIAARRGTSIFASKDGEVIYSSRKIRGYGNMIVIKHDDGMATVYAHNRKNLVKKGERVKQGQLVAFVGSMGKSTGPHVHFEIRKSETPQDPLLYLPQVRSLSSVARKYSN